jgi:hypothetical protein
MGLFWYRTNRFEWPPLSARLAGTGHRVAVSLGALFVLACLVVVGSAAFALLPEDSVGDWGPPRPFIAPRYPGEMLFVGTMHTTPLMVVREHFWGLPSWNTRFVLVAHLGIGYHLPGGDTFLMDTRRLDGLVTRFLPMVKLGRGRTRPVQYATLDLRMLREGPSPKDVRVIGQVTGGSDKAPPGVRVLVIGPAGTVPIVAVTDKDGIYDIPNPPPGHYEVRVAGCNTIPNLDHYPCDQETRSDLKAGEVFGVELKSSWD